MSFCATPAGRTCLFCTSACECNPTIPGRKRKRRPPAEAPSREVIRRERRAAQAELLARIEGRLDRAEGDAVFSLEDWDKIRHVLIPHAQACPLVGPAAVVRIPGEDWEALCDLLLTAEREKAVAALEGRIKPGEYGPDRYLGGRRFDSAQFLEVVRRVVPELFDRPEPEGSTSATSITDSGRAEKVRVMADRFDRGVSLYHPADRSVRRNDEPLPDWLAYDGSDEPTEQTYAAKQAALAARPRERPTLDGACDEAPYEFNFMAALVQPSRSEEWESGGRRCRTHTE